MQKAAKDHMKKKLNAKEDPPEASAKLPVAPQGTAVPARRGRPPKPKVPNKTPKEKDIIKYTNKGLTVREIAELTNMAPSSVHLIQQRLKENLEFQDFAKNKQEYFEELQWKLLKSMDTDVIKSIVTKQGVIPIAVLEDKLRLMRGEHTSLVSVDIRALLADVNANPPTPADATVIDVTDADTDADESL